MLFKPLFADEHPHFLQLAGQLADALRHTIFVDQVRIRGSLITQNSRNFWSLEGSLPPSGKRENDGPSRRAHQQQYCQGELLHLAVSCPQTLCISSDRERLLPPNRRHPTRFGDFDSAMFVLLWRYGEAVRQVYRGFAKRKLAFLLDVLFFCWCRYRCYWDLSTTISSLRRVSRRPEASWIWWLRVWTSGCGWILSQKMLLTSSNEGHPEYGCFISKDKTMTNFDFDADIMNVTEPHEKREYLTDYILGWRLTSSTEFRWCGFLISMEDLSVSADYSRFQGTSMVSAFPCRLSDIEDPLFL